MIGMTAMPDERGYFGEFGGRFVPEVLMPALEELTIAYRKAKGDPSFRAELDALLQHWAGRPTPLYEAKNLSARQGGARIYLKREDLLHTGAHKINNALGQGLLAGRMGKKRIVAETGAGQHGVAVAAVSALFGLECVIYMGEEDLCRQAPNVERMRLLGAEVVTVTGGSRTLKDAVNEAIRDWVTNVNHTYYLLGSAVGPHPYPLIVRDLQAVIGRETGEQMMSLRGALPDYIVACVGGGSNAIGIFHHFVEERQVKLIGVEAGGRGMVSGKHAASLTAGKVGVLHGAKSFVLQDDAGQIGSTHSISAGLDYPGVGPEHSNLKLTGRALYTSVEDQPALEAFLLLSRTEGIIPALESSHALAYALRLASALGPDQTVVVNLSGRGDKDMGIAGSISGAGMAEECSAGFQPAKLKEES